MKKLLALILAVCMFAVCCGCDLFGGNSSKVNSSKKSSSGASDTDITDDEELDDISSYSAKRSKGTVNMSGEPSEELIPLDDEEETTRPQTVESGKSKPTLETKWDKMTLSHPESHTDKEAEKMRKAVVNSKNGDYGEGGTTYYFSPKGDDNNSGTSKDKPKRTTNALNVLTLKPGDKVLFERGGVWHLSRAILCEEGVTYGAYGTGEKPAIYGSVENYASPEFWKATNLKNVWSVSVKDSSIGLIVFNDGELVGRKISGGLLALSQNGDFYFNSARSILYLYNDNGNPGKKYYDIEICLNKAAFDVTRISGVTIDNFKIKYFGRMGVDLCAADNSKVTNCEVGFIGGANQDSTTRLGNAIQMWQGCDGHLVENCWIYQVYDTAISPQGNSLSPLNRVKQGTHDEDYLNISYKNNLIEYCCLSFEFWQGNHNSGDGKSWVYTDGRFENIHVEGNLSRFAGYGWSSMPGQRPDPHGEHLVMYNHTYPYAKGFYIENNVFDLCSMWICRWQFSTEYKEDTNDYTRKKIGGEFVQYTSGGKTYEGVKGGTPQPIDFTYPNGIWYIRNNTYYQGKTTNNTVIWYGTQRSGSGQSKLEELIGKFDTSPTKVVWVS